MTRGVGYYRVCNEVEEFENEFIRQNRDDFFFHVEKDNQQEWINDTIHEYLGEWVSMVLSYKEKMTIISKYGLCEALALVNDMGTSIHDAICPEDALIYAIINHEYQINIDDMEKMEKIKKMEKTE